MEPIHIQLSDKRVDVAVPEVGRQYLILKELNVDNHKLSTRSKPVNGVRVGLILTNLWFTCSISYVFCMKRATEMSELEFEKLLPIIFYFYDNFIPKL